MSTLLSFFMFICLHSLCMYLYFTKPSNYILSSCSLKNTPATKRRVPKTFSWKHSPQRTHHRRSPRGQRATPQRWWSTRSSRQPASTITKQWHQCPSPCPASIRVCTVHCPIHPRIHFWAPISPVPSQRKSSALAAHPIIIWIWMCMPSSICWWRIECPKVVCKI